VTGAVRANPGLYFGAFPASDWPLVLAAWTAADLLRLVPTPAACVAVTLHRGGALSATVGGAAVIAPPSDPRPASELVRARMWYAELARATTVRVTPEAGWSDLTVAVHIELDAQLFGLPDGSWWRSGVTRFARLLATPRHRPPAGSVVRVTDEATGETADLPES
jgi:hypothetical protein